MIVCICHRVCDRDIVREARAGCASFDELQETLLVGTACGACLDCAHETFHAATTSGVASAASAVLATSAPGANAALGLHRVAPPASRRAATAQPA